MKNSTRIKKIAVLFGGRSSEHEISLRSCVSVLQNIPENYEILPVGIHRSGTMFLLEGKWTSSSFQDLNLGHLEKIVEGQCPEMCSQGRVIQTTILPVPRDQIPETSSFDILNLRCDCFFSIIHGATGEDGSFQGLFELTEIPYVGCGIRPMVLAIDKEIQKRLVMQAGIPVAPYVIVDQFEWARNQKQCVQRITEELGFPCFLKPNSSGSAVGANRAANESELVQFLKEAFQFDTKVLVEKFIQGTEIELAYLGLNGTHEVSTPGEVETDNFYSYAEKYSQKSKSRLYVPARLTEKGTEKVQDFARQVAKSLNLESFARIDFWHVKGDDERFIFNEVNAVPGLTSISMFPTLWEHDRILPSQWIQKLIDHAEQRQEFKNHLSKDYQ